MKVSVKTLKGNHFDIEVQPTDTVLNVKKQIEQTQGAQTYPSEQQMLIYQGRVLKDGTTIEENKVSENTFLVVMLSKTKATNAGASSTQAQPSVSAAPAQNPVAPVPAAAAAQLPSQAPATTTPAIGTGTTQTDADADAYGQAASNLVAGNNLEHVIQQILDMGGCSWDRDIVVRALCAACNNPERAVEYLYSGIPETAEVAPPVTRPTPSVGQAANPTAPAPAAAAAAGSATAQAGPNAAPLDLFPQTKARTAGAPTLDPVYINVRLARWNNTLSLPLQQPSTTNFSSTDINWSEVGVGRRKKCNKVALIPFDRVKEFVEGESSRTGYPNRFLVASRKKPKVDDPRKKPKDDDYLEYVLYCCRFGPDDRREGGTCRPSRECIKPSEKKRAGRRHIKKGCVCHFIVRHLSAWPSVALITYNQQKHVDKSGSSCHGQDDVGTPKKLRLWVISMLSKGFSAESIKKKHIEGHGGLSNCDDLVFGNYVSELQRDMVVVPSAWLCKKSRTKVEVEHKKAD